MVDGDNESPNEDDERLEVLLVARTRGGGGSRFAN